MRRTLTALNRDGATIPWLVPLLAITALAAFLRFMHLGDVPDNPFYDAAVRTMSRSWHAFVFGALEPGGSVSVDKPPVDLWLQVASVKIFGWSSTALKVPEALAGTLTVPLLYDLVRRPFGKAAGLASALALAVLPVAVLTSRSDTMDTVMVALVVLAAWLVVRGLERDRVGPLLLAGGVLGLAFNVKLFQALVAMPALAVLYLVGSSWPWRRRLLVGLGALAIFVIVSMAWIAPVALTPKSQRPFPVGSDSGSIWQLVFGFNGLDRIRPRTRPDVLPETAKLPGGRAAVVFKPKTDAGLTRLFGPHYGHRVGSGLFPGLALGGLALLVAAWTLVRRRGRRLLPEPGPDRLRLACALAFGVWLATGFALFSSTQVLKLRYVETISPAVAAAVGIGVVWLTARRRPIDTALLAAGMGVVAAFALWLDRGHAPHRLLAAACAAGAVVAVAAATRLRHRSPAAVVVAGIGTMLALGAALSVPAGVSAQIVRTRVSDAQRSGAMPTGWPEKLNRYLAAHRGGTRYELGSISPAKAAPLIAADPQPVLMLTSYRGQPLLGLPELQRKIASGEVRYFILGRRCAPTTLGTGACVPTARWVLTNGVDVTREAGLPHRGLLFRVDRCAVRKPASAAARGRTTTPRAPRSPQPRSRTTPATCALLRQA